jgi:hypothetical protein
MAYFFTNKQIITQTIKEAFCQGSYKNNVTIKLNLADIKKIKY